MVGGLVVVAMVCCVTCQVLLSAPVHVLQRRAQALGVVVPVMPMSSPRYAIALDAKLSGKAPSSALRRGEMKAVFEVCSPCQRPTRVGRVGVTHTSHVRRVASGRGILCVAGPCWNIRSSTPSITSVAARVEATSGGWPGIKRYHRAMRVFVLQPRYKYPEYYAPLTAVQKQSVMLDLINSPRVLTADKTGVDHECVMFPCMS